MATPRCGARCSTTATIPPLYESCLALARTPIAKTAMELAESCDLHGIVAEHVRIDGHRGANPGGKVATLVAGTLTGTDCIDDADHLRSGGMRSLFGGIYAPSTLGEFLRSFHHGTVRQLQAAAREFLVQLARRGPLLPGADAVAFLYERWSTDLEAKIVKAMIRPEPRRGP